MTELFHVEHAPLRLDLHLRLLHYQAALESIARNTCCPTCHEAALVARAALKGGPPMITVTGQIASLTPGEMPRDVPTPGEPEPVQMADVVVECADPHSGSLTLTVPLAATGGLAAGPCRVIIENA